MKKILVALLLLTFTLWYGNAETTRVGEGESQTQVSRNKPFIVKIDVTEYLADNFSACGIPVPEKPGKVTWFHEDDPRSLLLPINEDYDEKLEKKDYEGSQLTSKEDDVMKYYLTLSPADLIGGVVTFEVAGKNIKLFDKSGKLIAEDGKPKTSLSYNLKTGEGDDALAPIKSGKTTIYMYSWGLKTTETDSVTATVKIAGPEDRLGRPLDTKDSKLKDEAKLTVIPTCLEAHKMKINDGLWVVDTLQTTSYTDDPKEKDESFFTSAGVQVHFIGPFEPGGSKPAKEGKITGLPNSVNYWPYKMTIGWTVPTDVKIWQQKYKHYNALQGQFLTGGKHKVAIKGKCGKGSELEISRAINCYVVDLDIIKPNEVSEATEESIGDALPANVDVDLDQTGTKTIDEDDFMTLKIHSIGSLPSGIAASFFLKVQEKGSNIKLWRKVNGNYVAVTKTTSFPVNEDSEVYVEGLKPHGNRKGELITLELKEGENVLADDKVKVIVADTVFASFGLGASGEQNLTNYIQTGKPFGNDLYILEGSTRFFAVFAGSSRNNVKSISWALNVDDACIVYEAHNTAVNVPSLNSTTVFNFSSSDLMNLGTFKGFTQKWKKMFTNICYGDTRFSSMTMKSSWFSSGNTVSSPTSSKHFIEGVVNEYSDAIILQNMRRGNKDPYTLH